MNNELLQRIIESMNINGNASDKYFLAGIEDSEIETILKIAEAYHEEKKKRHGALCDLTAMGDYGTKEVEEECFTEDDIIRMADGEIEDYMDYLNTRANEYALNRAKKALEKAAENAKLMMTENCFGRDTMRIDKESITDPKNLEV